MRHETFFTTATWVWLPLAVSSWLSLTGCSSAEPAFQPSVTGGSSDAVVATGPDSAEPVDSGGVDAVADSMVGMLDAGSDIGVDDSSATDSQSDAVTLPMDVGVVETWTPSASAAAIIGTWNLHNFSVYGNAEWRMDDMIAYVDALEFDVLAVQELKVKEGSNGDGPQAFTTLTESIDGKTGLHAPWDLKDSTVGLIYNEATTTIHSSETLFETDWSAFPRAPLMADLSITKNGGETRVSVIVLHLKAFKDSVDRRRDACEKLVAYIGQNADREFVVIGDFNDDPNDPPASNSFTGTFLDAEPAFHFVTQALAPETVTSTGYYHYVDGTKITGEFLDHAVVTGGLHSAFNTVTATVLAKPSSEFSDWKDTYSDHFPVMISFEP